MFKSFVLTCPERSVRSSFVKILLIVINECAEHRVLDNEYVMHLLRAVVECTTSALQHAEAAEECFELMTGLCQIGTGHEGECSMLIVDALVRVGCIEALCDVLVPAVLGGGARQQQQETVNFAPLVGSLAIIVLSYDVRPLQSGGTCLRHVAQLYLFVTKM
jgi:hypothetical protein